MEEIHEHRKEIGNGPCEVLAIILFHPVICLHATLKAKYIPFFLHCKNTGGWINPKKVVSVAVLIHPGPGGDPPPFASG